ncbi:unnamed protein product, partial [Urochloa humidicola]
INSKVIIISLLWFLNIQLLLLLDFLGTVDHSLIFERSYKAIPENKSQGSIVLGSG